MSIPDSPASPDAFISWNEETDYETECLQQLTGMKMYFFEFN